MGVKMKKNLSDFANEKVCKDIPNITQEDIDNIDDSTQQEVKDLYEKYKDYSQDQLLSEFLSSSKKKIKQGSLSKEKLENTIDTLSPYINSEQKSFLDNLIKKLDD